MSKLASTKKTGQNRTLIQEALSTLSWDHEDVFTIQVGEGNWMAPIINFLINDALPEDQLEAKEIRRQAASYTVVNGELFRRGFSSPLLKCLDRTQADYVLSELHEGICEIHSGQGLWSLGFLGQNTTGWQTNRMPEHTLISAHNVKSTNTFSARPRRRSIRRLHHGLLVGRECIS